MTSSVTNPGHSFWPDRHVLECDSSSATTGPGPGVTLAGVAQW